MSGQYLKCRLYNTVLCWLHIGPTGALALEPEDIFAILSYLPQPVYELTLLVATCGLRISEPLGLKWRNILWDCGLIAIKQTFVHFKVQEGAKTKLSRSRVEAPKLLLDCLAAWRKETMYAGDDDFVFRL